VRISRIRLSRKPESRTRHQRRTGLSARLKQERSPVKKSGSSVVGLSPKRNSRPLTGTCFRSAPSLHGRYPLPRYYGLSDSREKKTIFTGLPGSSADLSARAVPNYPGKSDGCVLPLLSPSMAGFIQIRRTGHFHWRNEAESGSLALRLMRSPRKASPTRITPRQRSLGYFDERVISKISSFQLIRSARLRLAHRITRITRMRIWGSSDSGRPSSRNPRLVFIVFARAADATVTGGTLCYSPSFSRLR
jgi:hypothetical protein